MIHTDNAPIKPITPEQYEAHIRHLDRSYLTPAHVVSDELARWIREADAARDPANCLRFAAA